MVAKKHYSIREIYRITYDAARTRRFMAGTNLGRDKQFTERIMLAVTEVNGCELCSYAHTRFALEAGLSDAEIRSLLGGLSEGVPDHQIPAIAFAQHYADTGGHPDSAAWQNILDVYGEDEALSVLAAARIMMWGNAVGIPLSSLRSRLKGAADPGSGLGYEVATILGSTVVTPFALLQALVSVKRRAAVAPAASKDVVAGR
ncbi:alkylhydroperoxidase [Aeromicrobium sp. A1-2]|nr:alkylhydroperoxidase [Aeromicrobium sp. A1-2]